MFKLNDQVILKSNNMIYTIVKLLTFGSRYKFKYLLESIDGCKIPVSESEIKKGL